jgi:hypothetical protein
MTAHSVIETSNERGPGIVAFSGQASTPWTTRVGEEIQITA